MATYKVLQDIEAEDTLVGPLTLRQCIYAAIAALGIYLSVVVVAKHAPFLALVFLPFIAFGAFFAFPWSKQQPTEVWALAKVRFFFKPRKRIWNQSGAKQLVTITVPRAIKRAYTSNLTPDEVKDRLKALADTIDSRGWAIKNIELGYYTRPSIMAGASDSDRLIDQTSFPQDVPNYDESASSDIFDVQNNPVAQKFDILMAQSAGEHRQQIVDQMDQPQPAAAPSYWHMNPVSPQPAAPQAASDDAVQIIDRTNRAGGKQVLAKPRGYADYSTIRTSAARPGAPAAPQTAADSPHPPVTAPPSPAILELANNNDLNVATIAREAQARNAGPTDEVVVSLR